MMKVFRLKGIEGLPLKYLAMLLVAAVVLVAVAQITLNLQNTATLGTHTVNETVKGVLNESLSLVMNRSG
ncbi:MAG: hypothetical protein HY362_03165 [Candidatus Aenigmarchaeota archaeon]|nr:hypothetical protein [Candidatus Aenigmarchaeota archaeon]